METSWNRYPVLIILDEKYLPQLIVMSKINLINLNICVGQILKQKTRKDTKLKFCKTVAVSVALYGSEAW